MGRTFDVYGVGHALVDIQYKVEVETLNQLGIEKGVMTLIDAQRQQTLFAQLERDPIASASGGSAANTMIGVAQFGGNPFYACLTGRDQWGDFYQSDLKKAGVATDPVHRSDGTTGQCVVFITPDADRTLNTFLGVGSAVSVAQLDYEKIAASQYVYLEGYLLSSDNGFEACLQAQAMAHSAGTSVALTLSDPFMVATFKERFVQIVDNGVDVLFCNEDEANTFTDSSGSTQAIQRLGQGTPLVCVTRGANGVLIDQNGHSVSVPAVPTEAVDTNGAGDLFAGGFLYGITHALDVEQSGKIGSYAAAQVVAQYGPRLQKTLDSVETILGQFD